MAPRKSKTLFNPKAIQISADERRKKIRQMSHKRYRAKLTAKNPVFSFDEDIEGFVMDVSLGGFGLTTNAHIPVGIELIIEVPTTKQIFKFEGKVVWSGAIPKSGKIIKSQKENQMDWQMGIEIDTQYDEAKSNLESFLDVAI